VIVLRDLDDHRLEDLQGGLEVRVRDRQQVSTLKLAEEARLDACMMLPVSGIQPLQRLRHLGGLQR